jgi:hypothetical protein
VYGSASEAERVWAPRAEDLSRNFEFDSFPKPKTRQDQDKPLMKPLMKLVMKHVSLIGLSAIIAIAALPAQTGQTGQKVGKRGKRGGGTVAPRIQARSKGLHGYIGYRATRPPKGKDYGAGISFYSAVWPLIDKPLAGFQIGLPSTWITPDNSDNKDQPLAPVGTRARDHWAERGPTWSSVFQTVEGGLGYWAGNRFRYGPPKFSMNGTPQCYDYEIGSPGWSFFYDSKALRDDRLGVAQLSNRLLIPPDALPFLGNPNGKFLEDKRVKPRFFAGQPACNGPSPTSGLRRHHRRSPAIGCNPWLSAPRTDPSHGASPA